MFVVEYLSDKRTKYTGSKNIVNYKTNVLVVLYLTDNILHSTSFYKSFDGNDVYNKINCIWSNKLTLVVCC